LILPATNPPVDGMRTSVTEYTSRGSWRGFNSVAPMAALKLLNGLLEIDDRNLAEMINLLKNILMSSNLPDVEVL